MLGATLSYVNIAEKWGERPRGTNPCAHVDKYPERARERMLSTEELARLGDALISRREAIQTISKLWDEGSTGVARKIGVPSRSSGS
jgi:hypothetical protein